MRIQIMVVIFQLKKYLNKYYVNMNGPYIDEYLIIDIRVFYFHIFKVANDTIADILIAYILNTNIFIVVV